MMASTRNRSQTPSSPGETGWRNLGFVLAAFVALPLMIALVSGMDGAVSAFEGWSGAPVPQWLRDALVLGCYGLSLFVTCGLAVVLFQRKFPDSPPRTVAPPETSHQRGGLG